MRLTTQQIETIRHLSRQLAGEKARVRVFGSRLDDTARGGDLDLMIELDDPVTHPALLGAQLSAKISRMLQGRKVDVLISAPNLRRLPIHEVAYQEGVLLSPSMKVASATHEAPFSPRGRRVGEEENGLCCHAPGAIMPDDRLDPALAKRLRFLIRVVRKECRHLQTTDRRLFAVAFTPQLAAQLDGDHELAERVEAFVSRYGRLQDTLGDKLLPVILRALGEKTGAAIDNLDRAERLGWLKSTDEWLVMRRLRNPIVHESIEDTAVFCDALQMAHAFVPVLVAVADAVIAEGERRGWA